MIAMGRMESKMIRLAFPILLLAGCATTAEAPQHSDRAMDRVERTLAGLTPGAPQSCVPRQQVRSTRAADGVILYVGSRDRVWRNDVGPGCSGLSRGDFFVSRSFGSQYCRGDILQTQTPGAPSIFSGSCALGDFVPYTR